MNFEDLQKSWQGQGTAPKITINADLLLKEVRRNFNQFRSTIFWRDFREIGVGAVMVVYFARYGIRNHDWSQFLLAAAGLWVCAFMLIDRLKQRRTQPSNQDPLKDCIQASLASVSHQIWLLKNVFWWYLLPLAGACFISMVRSDLHHGLTGSKLAFSLLYNVLFVGVINWGIYRLNQAAVGKSLRPRQQELEAMLASLE